MAACKKDCILDFSVVLHSVKNVPSNILCKHRKYTLPVKTFRTTTFQLFIGIQVVRGTKVSYELPGLKKKKKAKVTQN